MNNTTYFMKHEDRFIAIRHSENGYHKTDVKDQEEADGLNETQSITAAECEAAMMCCMFENWDNFDAIKASFEAELEDQMRPQAKPEDDIPYMVYVDDNFHFTDESERDFHSEYSTFEEAVTACKKIVDDSLGQGAGAEEIYDNYVSFGDDPFIKGCSDAEHFSAWEYANKRSQEIVAAQN